MKVLFCGGRDYSNIEYFKKVFEYIIKKYNITCIVHGGASGADYLAGYFARLHNIPVIIYYADWKKYNKAAGIIRNKEMLEKEKPDLVAAFPGGNGTKHMIKITKEKNIKCLVVVEEINNE